MTNIYVSKVGTQINLTNHQKASVNVADFDPSDLLAGALAKCTLAEVTKVARAKQYELHDLKVRVDLVRNKATKTSNFKVHLELKGNLAKAELKKLQKAAKKSYINRLLSTTIILEEDIHLDGQVVDLNE